MEHERQVWVWYSPYGMGGVETYLLNIARETIRDGHSVWVAATKSSDGPLRNLFLEAGVQLLDWSDFHDAFMGKQTGDLIQRRLRNDIARIRPTLFALNDCNDFSIGVAPLLRKLRPYCTILDTFHIDSPIEQYLDFRNVFVDALDGIASTNQNVIDRFQRHRSSVPNLQTRYIANGVTVPDRERKPVDKILRLLYVGRLAQDQKRILDLPALLDNLRSRAKAFTMTIVGDGPCREALEAELSRRGLSDQVLLTGYLPPPEVIELYFKHDVFVNLSSFEGFSMSVLEAFAAGCVPVCTDVASLDRSIFQDGINCCLSPVDRLDRMVDIWSSLTPQLLKQLSIAARTTGRRLTANQTYLEYRHFLGDLRARRPLQRWPEESESALRLDWDLKEHNPWLERPHPVRDLARSAWTRVRAAVSGAYRTQGI